MKHLFLVGACLICTLPAAACDVCGIFLGIQPHDRVSSFGLFYRLRHLEGDLLSGTAKHGGHDLPSATGTNHYREFYQALEVRADLWLGQRFAVMGALPLVNNYQGVDGFARADVYGAGDPFVLARYMLANTRGGDDAQRTVHRVMLGAGVKAPLGRSDLRYQGTDVDHDLQPGTGTWDALATAEYLVRRGLWGGSLALTGRYNDVHSSGVRMGPGLSATAECFRQVRFQSFTWAPSLGAYGEVTGMDRFQETPVDGTGGSTLFTHVGSRVWWRAWMLTLTHQAAVAHDMGRWMVPNRQRFIVGITYNLIKN